MKRFTEIAHIVRRVETTYPPIVVIVVRGYIVVDSVGVSRAEREISLLHDIISVDPIKKSPQRSVTVNLADAGVDLHVHVAHLRLHHISFLRLLSD